MNMVDKVNHFQRRYANVVGVLTLDTRYKAPTSVVISPNEANTLRRIAISELKMLRRYHMSGNTLAHIRFNERMNQLATAIDMIALARKDTDYNRIYTRYYMQVIRIAVSCLLDV